MSVYTYHLIEALQGAGNREGDAEVHLSNLINYLGKTVHTSTQKFYQKSKHLSLMQLQKTLQLRSCKVVKASP